MTQPHCILLYALLCLTGTLVMCTVFIQSKKEIQRTEIKWNVYKRKLNKLIIIDKMVDDTVRQQSYF